MKDESGPSPRLPLAELPPETHLRIQSDLWFRSFTLILALLTLLAAFGGFAIFGAVKEQITALGVLLVVLLLASIRMFARGLSAAAFHKMNNEGLTHLSEGALAEAVRSFDELTRRAKGPSVYSIVSLYNLAYAELRRGRLERAQSVLATLESRPFALFGKQTLQQGCAALQAFIYALQGNVEAARAWMREAGRRQDDPKMVGYLVLAEALVHFRDQNFEAAEEVLARRWSVASSSLTGNPYAALRLLRAHALQQLGRPRRAVYEMIAGAKPYQKAELEYLRVVSATMARMVDENAEDQAESRREKQEARA